MTIEQLFYPKSVAVIGSMSEGKLGQVLLKQVVDGKFPGELYAVNPKAQGLYGVPGYTSVAGIGKPVDMAVIVTPAASVPSVLDDCGKGGVGAAVVITSGFSEMGNKAGEIEVLEAARRNNIRMIGPNCAGMVCTSSSLFPTLEVHPPEGGMALISQSGALGGVVTAWAAEHGIGMSKFVSYGNGTDLNQVELLRYLKDDPETKVIGLYIESIKNGREFMETLEEVARVKPVAVIKAGRTNVGKRATASHTGSMAGSDAVYDAAFKQCGAIRVKTVEELMDLCNGFVELPKMDGNKVIIVTNSGGPGVLAADMGEEVGLNMAEVSTETVAYMQSYLPPHCAFKNPIDLTVEGNEETYRKTLTAVLKEFDAAVAMNICPPYLDSLGHARGVADAAAASGKPVVANFLPTQVVENSVAFLKEKGIPNYISGERAVTTLSQISRYYSGLKDRAGDSGYTAAYKNLMERLGGKSSPLPGSESILEPDAMKWLQDNGLPTPPFQFAPTEDDAAKACAEIDYPCVMKVVSPQIIHKSEYGGVIVNIKDEAAARKAYQTIRGRAEGKDFCGVIIYPMVSEAQEVLLGLTVDPQFGPVVAFGLGGIYTEIFKDVVLRVAPIDRAEAVKMIHSIKAIKLLQGARGKAPSDLDTLADALVKFSELPFRYPEIAEMDLNPVFVLPKGLMIGDVRVIRKI